MAKQQTDPDYPRRAEFVGAGMLVVVLSLLWLAAEIGLIQTSVPVGPLVLMVAGLAMIVPHLRK